MHMERSWVPQWLASIQTFTLENGLQVVLLPDTASPLVAVVVVYRVGAQDERPGETGFAHLFEHMMFQSSAHVRKNEFFRYIESHGGVFNGNTTHERTVYYEVLPATQLPLALWLESDRMRALTVSQEHLDNQRDTVKEERRFRYDNQPYMRGWIRLGELLFANFANAHPVIGYYEDLDRATLPAVRAFFQRYYRPNHAVLVIAGDIDVAVTREWVMHYFADIAPGPEPERPDRTEPPVSERKQVVLQDTNARLPGLWMGWQIPPWGQADTYALLLLYYVLFEGKAARLYRKWIREQAICTQFYPIWDGRRGPGSVRVLVIARPDASVEMLLDSFYRDILTPPVTPEEFERARMVLAAQLWRRWQELLERALDVGESAALDHDPWALRRDLESLARVRLQDVQRVCTEYLRADRDVIVWITPLSQEQVA